MSTRSRIVLATFAAAAVAAGLGRAVTTTYLPVLLERIDDAPGLIGLVMLVNAAAGFAIPLVVGVWSDRRRAHGLSARLPFITGGGLLTAAGLAAIALGSSTSYLALALFAAITYGGLNAVTTGHRALVAELFAPERRTAATSAQEIALLVGGLAGLAGGGALTDIAPWMPFAAAAVVVPVLVLPTVSRTREPRTSEGASGARRSWRAYVAAARRPGVMALLSAEVLWVLGYAALPAFFVLYAERVLGLTASTAALGLAGFGVVTGAVTLAAGRLRSPARLRTMLALGVASMGVGSLAVAAVSSWLAAAPGLILAAGGFGLVSTVGYPLLASMIPSGQAGTYTALFFSVRAVGTTIALPAAGGLIAVTGSYRALFVLGGVAGLAAVVPLVWKSVRIPRLSWGARWTAGVAALFFTVLALGKLASATALQAFDERLFKAINGLGPGPDLLWTLLDPHTRNYLILIGLGAAVGAASGIARSGIVVSFQLASAVLAWGLLEAVYALFDRPRPEEALGRVVGGGGWAHIESYPSGHLAITAALAVALAFAVPRLRHVLMAYVLAVAITRVLFGAHFPLDTIAGAALGVGSALAMRSAFMRVEAALEHGTTRRDVLVPGTQ